MNGRIKFQVWSESQQRWRTVYVVPDKLRQNVILLSSYGFKSRVGSGGITIRKFLKAFMAAWRAHANSWCVPRG